MNLLRMFFFRSALVVLLALYLAAGNATATEGTGVGVIEPAKRIENPTLVLFVPHMDAFWKSSTAYARAAAGDLDVTLRVVDVEDDPAFMLKEVERVCREGADGIIFPSLGGNGEAVLRIAEGHGVPAFLINADIQGKDLLPRTKYRHWVGKLTPDEENAGAVLLQQLIEMVRAAGVNGYRILAIEGHPGQEVSRTRRKGLEKYLRHGEGVFSLTVLPGYWDPGRAAGMFKEHYKKFPETNIVWCADDAMAVAVADAAREMGITTPLFIGGVGWGSQALKAIREGRLHAVVGGSFMEGAWAVLLLHDYLNGRDFAGEGLAFTTSMPALTRETIRDMSFFLALDPEEINFRFLSKFYNPNLRQHHLDLAEVARSEGAAGKTARIPLSAGEKAWLAGHPEIRVAFMENWPPMNFVDRAGEPDGIGTDYLKALNKRLGVKLSLVPGPFKDNLNQVKEKRLDALMDITPKKAREPFFHFTKPYLTIPHVIVARKDGPYFSSEAELAGKTVALERDYYNIKYFQRNYPDVHVLEYGSTSEALDAVSRGIADAYAGNRAVVTYLIERELLANLHVQGRMKKPPVVLTIGVRKDWPELASMLDRALASLTHEEEQGILRKWVGEMEPEAGHVDFTTEERAWLARHDTLRLGVDPAWPPFEFVDPEKRHAGIASDYVRLLGGWLRVAMEPVEGLAWTEVLAKAKAGELDVLSAVTRTPDRMKHLLFTKPYASIPLVLVTRRDAPFVEDLGALRGKTLAVVQSYPEEEYLERDHPGLRLDHFESMEDALRAVAEGKAFAVIGNLASIDYFMKKLGLENLKVAATTPYKYDICFGVRKGLPELVPILDKALMAFTKNEKEIIRDKWVNFRVEREVDWAYVKRVAALIAAIALLVIAMFFWWNRQLAREVTERKRVEAELRKLTRAVEQSQASIVITDKAGAIEYVNPYFLQITGYTTEEALGQNPRVLKSDQHLNSFYREMWETIVSGHTWRGEICNKKKDGTLFWEDATISPLKDEQGHVTHYIAVKEDITERKDLEQLREDVDRIMRHDLKTPLNGIINLPQIMVDDENLTPEQVEYLKLIQDAGYRMLNQINLSLDLYKMETGAYEFVPTPVDMSGLLGRLFKDLSGQAKARGVVVEMVGECPCMVMAEELLSHTMFSNILANAVEASSDGGTVTVRIETGEDVAVSVHNMGAVPEAIRDRFFEKYATHGKKTGTGLGTYSAKLMAETQGGTIGFETSEEAGTTITIRLPRG